MSRPLYSLLSEMQALWAMCSSKLALRSQVISLSDEDFATETGSEIYTHIQKVVSKTGQPPVWGTLSESPRLTDETRETIESFSDKPRTAEDVAGIVTNIRDMRKTRVILKASQSALSSLRNDEDADIDDIGATLMTAISGITLTSSLTAKSAAGGDTKVIDEMVHNILYNPTKDFFIPTGFDTWDRVNGGLPRGGTFLIGLNSGGGKSHLINQLSINQALCGYKVLVIPLEMMIQEVITRGLANIGEVDSLRLMQGLLTQQEADVVKRKWNGFKKACAAAGGELVQGELEGYTLSAVEMFNFANSVKPDVLLCDYAGLLDESGSDKQWQTMGDILRRGKLWAGHNNAVFGTAVQIDDETSKIRYSQMMKEHASVAWVGNVNDQTREDGVLPMTTVKARNQKYMRFPLGINYPHSKVFDVDPTDPVYETYSSANGGSGGKAGSGPKRAQNKIVNNKDGTPKQHGRARSDSQSEGDTNSNNEKMEKRTGIPQSVTKPAGTRKVSLD